MKSVDVPSMITAHQVNYVILITSATALAWDTKMIVQQTMEMMSTLAVLLANAAVRTTSVDVQATVIVLQTKYARHQRKSASLSSIGYLLIVICWEEVARELLHKCRLM